MRPSEQGGQGGLCLKRAILPDEIQLDTYSMCLNDRLKSDIKI